MKVLVAVASKHGATAGIAAEIGAGLAGRGLDVQVVEDPATVRDLRGVDAVLLGSAVYAGRWMRSAKEFASRLREELEVRPVWLFSSGPVGDREGPDQSELQDVTDVVAITGAREHRMFSGALDRSQLGLAERAIVGAMRIPDSDDRDWEDVAAWADHVADRLLAGDAALV